MAEKMPAKRLGKPIAFRLTDEDREAYLAKVDQSGLTQSEFFRQAVLENRTQIVARQRPTVDRKRLLFIVSRAGNNINQLAHRANAEHVKGKLTEATYERLLDELQFISRYLNATLVSID
ncbi:plasmid mobilization protein [Paraburkholderia flagellata]|uniref:plasmid mobilization protein n=1 Tax=Paraburkholderia flagellata TaxID=2883241 RepID=UPI001F1C4CBA|nr:plasmid mobilization relaxosome protein MobC [Paraburkholderia flagellata]